MTLRVERNLVLEDVRIGFRNFSGVAGKYNPAGSRNFVIFLDHDHGIELEEEGWKIRWLEPREEEELPTPILEVAVSYTNIPPKIIMVSGPNKTIMEEDTVGILDWADIEMVDIIIRPYNWEVNGKTGVKAYVKTMYVTIHRDEFAHKYDDIDDEPTF